MTKLRFTREALDHIADIQVYIEGRNPQAAKRVAQRIYAAADRLQSFPRLGHLGVVSGTYELAVRPLPYILVHQHHRSSNEVVVLAVFHCAQSR